MQGIPSARSFALTLACRQPRGLGGLALSGGFAANPLPRWKAMAAHASRLAGGPLYRQGVLRFHAFQLSSRFDASAPIPHTRDDYRRLFIYNTPRSSSTARVRSVTRFDIRDRLHRVTVPALVLTPEDDRIVGRHAADEMLRGMPHSREIVLAGTGHMFRVTHPDQYAAAITDFLRSDVVAHDAPAAVTAAEELRYLILAAQREGSRMLADLLRPLQLTPAQGEVLRVLAEQPGLSLAELGHCLICETGSPSRLVDGLVTAGLVERAPVADDRRQIALTLTAPGRPKARVVQDTEQSLHDYLAAALGPRELSRTPAARRRLVAGTRAGEAARIRSTQKRSRSEELAR